MKTTLGFFSIDDTVFTSLLTSEVGEYDTLFGTTALEVTDKVGEGDLLGDFLGDLLGDLLLAEPGDDLFLAEPGDDFLGDLLLGDLLISVSLLTNLFLASSVLLAVLANFKLISLAGFSDEGEFSSRILLTA